MANSNTTKVIASIAFIAIAGSVASYSLLGQKTATIPTNSPSSSQPIVVGMTQSPSTMPSPIKAAGSYKDGAYFDIGTYTSPAGEENMDISITLKNDVITAAEVTPKATIAISQRFQEMFASEFKQYVIGKNINEVKLTKVSGSSLSTLGFNNALEKIKAHAKA